MKTIELPIPDSPLLLLIEDEPGDAELIRWQLQEDRSARFRIELVNSLAAARELIEQQHFDPDVVLLDLNLPDSTGYVTVERCRNLTEAPIIVLTGLDDHRLTQEAIQAGADDYLCKGGDASLLARAIRYALLRYRRDSVVRLASNVFSCAREGILISAPDGTILDVNEALSTITGFAREELLGQNPRLFKSDRHDPVFYQALWQSLLDDGYWHGEVWNRRKSGEVYVVIQTISAVRDRLGHVQQYVALISDITSFKEHESQLRHVAHHDALTALPNRVLLADRLHQAMVKTQRCRQTLAVIYLDLDGFKAVNDEYGHKVGDQLLVAIANRMKAVLREDDTLARLGGDEFVAVLQNIGSVTSCAPMLGRLLSAAAEPVFVDNLSLQVSASLGVTTYPQRLEIDADQLLRQADQAMYQAKLSGKNRYHFFDSDQDDGIRGLHSNLERIRQALVGQQFVLFYQPKVNMRTGEVKGLEALIRWQHPEQGLLSPAAFLPIVEGHPLAIELGEWVLVTALAQIQSWGKQGLHLGVSVNVSALQLQKSDFINRLRAILALYPDVPPERLEIEVLESSALGDLVSASRVIAGCRELGVRFALDDFGTGYSSLSYLKRLPVSQLKIDQSFVRDMLQDPDDLTILQGVVGLATAFRHEVIAEGVENVEQGRLLLQLGCDLAQGYGIKPPMPAEQIPSWVESWQTYPAWSNVATVDRVDLPLLFASVEYRYWLSRLQEFLLGMSAKQPELDGQLGNLGRWLNDDGFARYSNHPAFCALQLTQRRIHMLAANLCANRHEGLLAPQDFSELDELSRDLVQQVELLLQSSH